jgi:hypothetical protein
MELLELQYFVAVADVTIGRSTAFRSFRELIDLAKEMRSSIRRGDDMG